MMQGRIVGQQARIEPDSLSVFSASFVVFPTLRAQWA